MKWFPNVSVSFDDKAPAEPCPSLVAAKELNEARMDKLKAERELEYWRNMSIMLNERIARLVAFGAS